MSDYSSTYPTQSPTFAFDAKAGKLDSRLSYSRSSTGTYMSNEKALSSENLLLQSQDFDTSPWQNFNLAASGLTGGATAPDETSTAWLLTSGVSSNSASTPGVYMNLYGTGAGMVQPNSQNTYIIHVKAGTATHAWATVRGDSSNYVAAVLDFSNTSSLTTYQAGWTLNSYQLTALGNSWYRVALTFTSNSVVNAGQVYVGPTDSNTLTTYYPQWAFNGETIFVWGAQLSATNSKFYDSPTTTQISRSYSPLLKTASADEPRFEYAADGQSVGLLIESQATNLQRYGSDFANWVEPRHTEITSNVGIAPNGLLEADLAVPDSSANYHYVYDTAAVIANATTYTGSVYVKKAGHRYIQITASTTNFGSSQYATFDLDNGSIDANNVTASAESVGNGWWRIQATMTSISAGTGGLAITFANTATGPIFPTISGNDYDGVLLWGWQLETGSSASSLVNSGSLNSTISRASDSCSVADFGYTGGPISITAEANTSDVSSASKILFRYDGGDVYTNYFQGSLLVNYVTAGASTQALQYPSSVTAGTDYKVASRVDTNSINSAANGTAQAADTSAVLPDLAGATLHIGGISGSQCLNGNLKNLKVFSAPLTDTNLTALTS